MQSEMNLWKGQHQKITKVKMKMVMVAILPILLIQVIPLKGFFFNLESFINFSVNKLRILVFDLCMFMLIGFKFFCRRFIVIILQCGLIWYWLTFMVWSSADVLHWRRSSVRSNSRRARASRCRIAIDYNSWCNCKSYGYMYQTRCKLWNCCKFCGWLQRRKVRNGTITIILSGEL